jgi:hypothetical protein
MRFLPVQLIALSVLAAVQAALASMNSPDCDTFLAIKLASGYTVSDSAVFQPGTLNSSGIVNKLKFCRVQGTVDYDQDDMPTSNGPNTLTWNLYLPEPNNYNGRFLAVGKMAQLAAF